MLQPVCLTYPLEQHILYDSVIDNMSMRDGCGLVCHVYDVFGELDEMDALRFSDVAMELWELEYVSEVSVYWVSTTVIRNGIEEYSCTHGAEWKFPCIGNCE
jgi:hypothetical protein